MSTLYPRLLPDAASEMWKALQQHGLTHPQSSAPPSLSRAVFAATGGRRVTVEQLSQIRADIVRLAWGAGMPLAANVTARTAFDLSVARHLHERLDLAPGEASQRPIWTYLALVLLPDVCAWRFPANEERGYFEERFRCIDVSRHTLSRLWLRAHLLHNAEASDPYDLIGVLGEADMDQIIARRRDVASSRGLVRAIVRAHRDDPDKRFGRALFRDSLQRLLRLAAFLDFDSMESDELLQLVMTQRDESRRVLTDPTPTRPMQLNL